MQHAQSILPAHVHLAIGPPSKQQWEACTFMTSTNICSMNQGSMYKQIHHMSCLCSANLCPYPSGLCYLSTCASLLVQLYNLPRTSMILEALEISRGEGKVSVFMMVICQCFEVWIRHPWSSHLSPWLGKHYGCIHYLQLLNSHSIMMSRRKACISPDEIMRRRPHLTS